MKTATYNINSHDHLQLFGQGWEPEKPKAVFCLVHGVGEHSGRYQHMAQVLTQADYAVLAFDLRGHGKSDGPRGHTPSFESYMQDIDRLLEIANERHPGLPCFLFGHSLGGILVLNYGLRRQSKLHGIISSAAGLRTALEQQKLKVFLAKMLGSIAPSGVMASGVDPATISRDPIVVEKYVNDPLVHDKISFGMGKSVLEAIQWAFAHASAFKTPLLIMHGDQDHLGFVSGSQEFSALVPKHCTLKIWQGLSHELHNEPEKQQVFTYLINWMTDQLT